MGERGWDFTIGDDKDGPSLHGNTAPEQRDAMMADMQECKKLAGDHPFEEMSEALAHKLYAEIVKRAKCLSALGYDIQQPPSEAKWVAQQLAQDPNDSPWDPYEDLSDVNVATWSKVTDACPQGGLWGD